ncbi:hypothetical protein Fot_35540 [Forsythia ovata]|uniref:Uncharacterized protein n=1 Tax=Forsythia ovata TaxID=205694 RepID=A0ABD1SLU1_9LAMI
MRVETCFEVVCSSYNEDESNEGVWFVANYVNSLGKHSTHIQTSKFGSDGIWLATNSVNSLDKHSTRIQTSKFGSERVDSRPTLSTRWINIQYAYKLVNSAVRKYGSRPTLSTRWINIQRVYKLVNLAGREYGSRPTLSTRWINIQHAYKQVNKIRQRWNMFRSQLCQLTG